MKTPLFSFACDYNDANRINAVVQSKKYGIWYCVTLDGDKWYSYYQLPDRFMQAVVFQQGKKVDIIDGSEPEVIAIETVEVETVQEVNLNGVVLMSAFRDDRTPEANLACHEGLVRRINQHRKEYGTIQQTVIGSWKGKQEVSIAVKVPMSSPSEMHAQLHSLRALANAYQQEAMLFVNADGVAYIIGNDADGGIDADCIGCMREVNRVTAMRMQAWTMAVDSDNQPRWFVVD